MGDSRPGVASKVGNQPVGQQPAAPAAPAINGAPAIPGVAHGVPPVQPVAPATPNGAPAVPIQQPAIQPSTAFLQVPAAAPAAIPAPLAASTEPRMAGQALANGWTYAALKQAGHTDESMRASGWLA